MQIKSKIAVVTGGSRGIGAAITKKLASLGADVIVVYAAGQEAAEEVCRFCREQYGVRAAAYGCDVADFAAVKQLAAEIKKEFGTVHILVNNAGVTRDGLAVMMSEASYDAVLDTNLKGAFNMIRHFSSMMIRGREGRIVDISSVSGLMGNPGQANYAASKAGLIGLTKSIAKELASKNVTCNAIAPGFIETAMTKEVSDKEAAVAAAIPLGRMGKPEEVADAAAFLIGSDYITGTVLRVDGGIAM
ncbi:MAG: 3-oxoacyl-[acyl-carrier-protein] reductase [Oscillospiraceae bacterium]|nr:3-oxoacyl-[acyl-carrier-protein] reductase [Oscillospiraceae bacterium]